jgi:iron complex outermembrane receptor protein
MLCFIPAAVGAGETPADLTELSLEQLLDTEVTSVAKLPHSLAHSPAAVFVVTQNDIRRLGATSIPEALRFVPGLHVERIDRNKWAISTRGFNGQWFANKMLVLIDGRTVYNPGFSGVWWDVQDTMMEDIERIEVIRGPGASLWGANAVNGVINVITQSARQTQGNLLSAAMGTQDHGMAAFRHGGSLGEDAHYRVFGKYFDRDDYVDENGHSAGDTWRAGRGGFRVDGIAGGNDTYTVQGDIYRNDSGSAPTTLLDMSTLSQFRAHSGLRSHGANVLGRWTHSFGDESAISVQTYWDRAERIVPLNDFHEIAQTFDIEFQHSLPRNDAHQWLWGAGYRLVDRDEENSAKVAYFPEDDADHWFNLFVQDEIAVIPDNLSLTLGSKFEHKSRVGFLLEPNARLLWTPDSRNSIWLSVARAMRTPSWGEQAGRFSGFIFLPGPPLTTFGFRGNHAVPAEELVAYELGWRAQPRTDLFLDLALFYNVYDRLGNVPPPGEGDCALRTLNGTPFIECLAPQKNQIKGESYGLEAVVDWRPVRGWRGQLGYTLMKVDVRATGSPKDDRTVAETEGSDPRHQLFARSSLDLTDALRFDLMYRYVDELPFTDVNAHSTLDARLAWDVDRDVEISLQGRNLIQARHFESGGQPSITATQMERDVLAAIRWKF